MEFIAGCIVGGLIWSIMIYLYLKGYYEKEIAESYSRGYKVASEFEKRALLNYIESLERESRNYISDEELPKGSDL
jgi:hypothetical protein